METRSYIFIEEQYLNLPITQEILDERGDQFEPLVTGVDSDGLNIVEERTTTNTSIKSTLLAYRPTKKYSRFWFNGVDIPTRLSEGEDAPLDEEGEPKTGGKVFIVAGLPNLTFVESNSLKAAMDQLINPDVAAAVGVEEVAADFKPWLSHKQILRFIREGVL